MTSLYKNPIRVYLILGAVALWGILSGVSLPVSLYPNSSRPTFRILFKYGNLTPDEFLNTYGSDLEYQVKSIVFDGHKVDTIQGDYGFDELKLDVKFEWGTPPRDALKEVTGVVNSFAARLPQEIRDSQRIWNWNENSGFLAISFFSSKQGPDALYRYLDPILTPKTAKVSEAENVFLWNPEKKEITLQLIPEKMASNQVLPSDIARSVQLALRSYGGGSIKIGVTDRSITLPRQVNAIDDVEKIIVVSSTGRTFPLKEVAKVDYGTPLDSSNIVKTSGAPSLILWADPRAGGNVKKMAEDIIQIVKDTTFTPDISYKVLVDPSEFIRSAVNNVVHEVFLAAFLAVCVLFLFIGSIKNVATAAIEIPLSIILAFILMKWTGINLNLISLGGLALSAGMNVDASVVVMENIFRHFERIKGPISYNEKVRVLITAVKEVSFPVIASTIASVVVFLPLAFTSKLTNAILGDLALAVVFSHGFSAIVALILVPTVRLHIMKNSSAKEHRSPFEGFLKRLETKYSLWLNAFLNAKKLRYGLYGGLTLGLVALIVLVIPRLPKEIIGKPDTDWIFLMANSSGNTLTSQMEEQGAEIENRLLTKFGDQIAYTFTMIRSASNAQIMARLKDKTQMESMWKKLEAEFVSEPYVFFSVFPWNPSELPIPHPPQLKLAVRGEDPEDRRLLGNEIVQLLNERKYYQSVTDRPSTGLREDIFITPQTEQLALIQKKGFTLLQNDLAEITRVATKGQKVGEVSLKNQMTDITMRFPESRVASVQDIEAIPIGVDGRLIPLKAFARVGRKPREPLTYREEGKSLVSITAETRKEDEKKAKEFAVKAQRDIENLVKEKNYQSTVTFDDPDTELNEALRQLVYAIALSILLIFLTMVIQFGDVVNALLVLVAVPLGIIGVAISLFVFKSTLSLNSALGVILLNGLAVANSIILVDFLKRLVDQGIQPREAALIAARTRLRPILMTSMTTGLGMLPIAIGFGEGGKILQPLGIAVIGGLGFSMLLTLFLVPALQVSYLESKKKFSPMTRPQSEMEI